MFGDLGTPERPTGALTMKSLSLDAANIPVLIQITVTDEYHVTNGLEPMVKQTAYLTPSDHGCDDIQTACELIRGRVVAGYATDYSRTVSVEVRPL